MQWNIVLSLFFVPYILFEVPSNVFLKRCARPSIYMGVLVTTWGIIMTMHGVVTNYAGLLALRILLGVFEAGFFPGAVYLCVSAVYSHLVSCQIDILRPSGTCHAISLPVSPGSTASALFRELFPAWLPQGLHRWTASAATRVGDGYF